MKYRLNSALLSWNFAPNDKQARNLLKLKLTLGSLHFNLFLGVCDLLKISRSMGPFICSYKFHSSAKTYRFLTTKRIQNENEDKVGSNVLNYFKLDKRCNS